MLIAIDHGNYAIKTPHHSFVSGLSEHTVKPPMADEILEYDGRYWTPSGKRLSYMRDKTQDERYFILTLFAIAKELEDTGRYSPVEQIQLAVGLPPEHYGVLKDKFARYFKRDGIIKFVYKDKPYSIMIDKVMVFPQAYAAVVPKSSMVVNMLRVFVVDIGGYTTDVLLLKNGKPDLQFCRSLETGIITMNNEIIRKVGALHDMRIEDEHISAVLSGQDTILPDDVNQPGQRCGTAVVQIVLSSAKLLSFLVCKRGGPAWPPLAGYFFRLLTFRKIRPPMMNTTSAMAIIAFSSIKSFLLTQIQTAVILRYGCPFCACPHRPQRPGRQRP